jgi:hypothetical protein
VTKQCNEPFAEVPSDQDDAHGLQGFQAGDGGLLEANHHRRLLLPAEARFART